MAKAGLKFFASKQSWHKSACIDVNCESYNCNFDIAFLNNNIPLVGCFCSTKYIVIKWHNSETKIIVEFRSFYDKQIWYYIGQEPI